MNYKLKKKVIYSLVILAMLFGFSYIAYFGIANNNGSNGSASDIKLGLDLAGGVSITYETVDPNPSAQNLTDTIYKLQQRVGTYSNESEVYKEGGNRIAVEIPDVTDANTILEQLGTPGSLEFLDDAGYKAFNAKTAYTPLLTGSDVKTASAYTDSAATTGSKYGVNLEFNDEGAKKFESATAANIGKAIYIVYDGATVSQPIVETTISGGSAVINKMESFETADKLASYIRIGSIPCELKEISSNVVGAKLGADAIRTSIMATIIGLLILFAFMIVVYRIPGIVACISLIIYTAAVILMVSYFEITLTLPGIAGIILGIGMAVDANIIIYSRIKEEIGDGKTIENAIHLGFHKALTAIIDGNITTLIAAFVLAIKGSGSVQGFAKTLAIGVLVSMFTSIFLSRTIIKLLFSLGVKNPKLYGATQFKKIYDFMKRRYLYLGVSIIIIIAGFGYMIFNSTTGNGAFNYSLEFVGGTVTTVEFNENMSQAEIEDKVIPVIQGVIEVNNGVQQQRVTDSNQVIFKTITLDLAQREALDTALETNFNVPQTAITAETISATVSEGMKNDAIIAVVVSILLMLLYIWIRFKDIKFAASAVIALAIDLLVLLAFYSFSRTAVGNTFIACMLTILGYSINATIIIFDRIRENLKTANSKTDLKVLVNTSITHTLSRSINTNLTVFIVLLVLYIVGVGSIKEFALPLLVGVAFGTFSSVCITGGLWYTFKMYADKKKNKVIASK
ncbi:protein translocase subunit SecD [[Clostridium] fimetarium]|uniref:Multifunctional fusion protein n=1 Tax=[Clostridium] fimetarium TaxID=99656 RepID=A0A1I0QBD9_9FIRM|nr:protein translocase subunit SecD [[Clostridium] fimetarium]SEW24215.1 SecD/SecF fusion protein [[Clostridium] fimetarium]